MILAEVSRADGPSPSAVYTTWNKAAISSAFLVMAVACGSTPGRAPNASLLDEDACAGIPDQDRDNDPFSEKTLVEGVVELREPEPSSKIVLRRLRGATVVLRATPQLTRPWLGRVIHCHVMRHAAALLPDRDDDPLAVGHPEVAVRETETGFAVEIRSANYEDAREIVRRARGLTALAR
jgi:hypothetical protein